MFDSVLRKEKMTIRFMLAGSAAVAFAAILPFSGHSASVAKQFYLCQEGVSRIDCVVDGDTFWMDGIKIRIADIDAPETHAARCQSEQDLGDAATYRLIDLLNAGPFDLTSADRDHDQYGRKLRILERDGQSLGAELVNEGVARKWDGARHPWCN